MRPRLQVLSDGQIERIHLATLEVLERTGLQISHPKALALLSEAGARIDGERVFIPSRLVEETVFRSRPQITLGNRRGEQVVVLSEDRSWYGAGLDCIDYLDPITEIRRPFNVADCRITATIANALPNYGWAMCLGLAADADPAVADRMIAKEAMTFCEKPLAICCYDITGLIDIYNMASLIAGGEDRFSAEPTIMHLSSAVSPLSYYHDTVEKIFFCVEKGIPQIFYPGLQAGATSPATFAGTVIQGSAESLGGMILAQLIKKDAPVIYGAFTTIMDMATAVFSYGAPEMNLMNAALAQMAKFYQVPFFGTAGCSDAKFDDDPQAVVEAAFSCLNATLTGADLIHDIGLLDHSTLVSPRYLVLFDEVISMVDQYMRGISLDEDMLALDVIDQVGPGGHFLAEQHTVGHYRDVWYSKLFDRTSYEDWKAAGGKLFKERLIEKTRSVLQVETEPLPAEVIKELDLMEGYWK